MKDKNDINHITRLFRNKFKLELQIIPTSNKKNEKTADLKLVTNDTIRFVCELKTLKYTEPNEKTGYTKGECHGEWWKNDATGPSRIAHLIKAAYPQLAIYKCPKILIFLNETFDVSELDYFKATRGYLGFTNKTDGTIKNEHWWHHISDVGIKEIKKMIDVYIWINKRQNGQDQIWFDKITAEGKSVVEKYFKPKLHD